MKYVATSTGARFASLVPALRPDHGIHSGHLPFPLPMKFLFSVRARSRCAGVFRNRCLDGEDYSVRALAYLGRRYGHEAFAYLKDHGWQAGFSGLRWRGRRDRAQVVPASRGGIGESGMRLGLFCCVCVCAAAQEPAEILGRIRHNVMAQISRSANYTCVDTIERNYFLHIFDRTCGRTARGSPQAISARSFAARCCGFQPIGDLFGTARIISLLRPLREVVRGGPISSGGFVGYLMNIFLQPNISISYVGESNHSYNFQYDVPLPNSKYQTPTAQRIRAHTVSRHFQRRYQLAFN